MFNTPSSPHFHGHNSVTRMMLLLVLALVPGISAYVWFFGWGVMVNIVFALIVAYICEALVLVIRKKPLGLFLKDGSAGVTAILLALSIPPMSPWWLIAIGVIFAIVIAKHLYGGLGYNPFNPAMVGYAVLLISFPLEMTTWIKPIVLASERASFSEMLYFFFNSVPPAHLSMDSMTGATPLDLVKTQITLEVELESFWADSAVLTNLSGVGFEWVSIGFLAGGILLLYKRVISWHIPVSFLLGLFMMAWLTYAIDPEHHVSPVFHLFGGAAMLGAFFVATDPVTAPSTNRGRVIYGVSIGVLTYVIRAWGGYPDGVAFAVLIMNMCAPTIDYYTRNRVFGYGKK
ncbi:MAG: electron transport complex subunit RsxD [Gammaproteobacteria bacterium]|nr:electron transport complex subunit RsxD [Gammaproteobacteria bacterium]